MCVGRYLFCRFVKGITLKTVFTYLEVPKGTSDNKLALIMTTVIIW